MESDSMSCAVLPVSYLKKQCAMPGCKAQRKVGGQQCSVVHRPKNDLLASFMIHLGTLAWAARLTGHRDNSQIFATADYYTVALAALRTSLPPSVQDFHCPLP
mmetsp:Transcript_14501/g.25738  ORF Transcript_14501/g.25738 Transcript_14501/m.25738 type:complete len:103 (-) Transcript_14501:500-808(-)